MKLGIDIRDANDCRRKENRDKAVCKFKTMYNSTSGSKYRKIIGVAVMVFGFLMITPPFLAFDDFINVIIAGALSTVLPISPLFALFLTYILIGGSILLVGAYIFPGKTSKTVCWILNMTVDTFKGFKTPRNIILISASIFTMTMVLTLYYKYIGSAGIL